MHTNKVSPRTVSNVLGELKGTPPKSKKNLSMFFVIFSQFLDHEMVLTPIQTVNNITKTIETMSIDIPMCDAFMDKNCEGGKTFSFTRSLFETPNKVRSQINIATAWIDGSQIYSSIP